MTAKLARLQNTSTDTNGEKNPARRKETRRGTWFKARIESSHGDRADMLIAEISEHGCRVMGDVSWMRIGAFVSIAAEGGRKIQAITRWVRNDAAGFEFLRPIPSEYTEWHNLIDQTL